MEGGGDQFLNPDRCVECGKSIQLGKVYCLPFSQCCPLQRDLRELAAVQGQAEEVVQVKAVKLESGYGPKGRATQFKAHVPCQQSVRPITQLATGWRMFPKRRLREFLSQKPPLLLSEAVFPRNSDLSVFCHMFI